MSVLSHLCIVLPQYLQYRGLKRVLKAFDFSVLSQNDRIHTFATIISLIRRWWYTWVCQEEMIYQISLTACVENLLKPREDYGMVF